jgi:hypothetical protein
MFKTTAMIVSALLLLLGCADSSVKEEIPANVTSNPSGADVFANLLELGKTPLRANLYDAFPAGWQNSIYQAQGVLVVKKDGCKDFTLKVNDLILSKPIHAELKCSEATKPEKSTATVSSPNVTTTSNTEKRLEELEGLYKKGIVTKEEYQNTRARILNEL